MLDVSDNPPPPEDPFAGIIFEDAVKKERKKESGLAQKMKSREGI